MYARRNWKQNFTLRVTSLRGKSYVNESQASDWGSKLYSMSGFPVAMTGINSENASSLARVLSYIVQRWRSTGCCLDQMGGVYVLSVTYVAGFTQFSFTGVVASPGATIPGED